MKQRYLNMTYKQILLDVLTKVKIVDNYDEINKDYNNKVEELNAKIKDLERVKGMPIKPVKQLITNETELLNFIEQNKNTPEEVHENQMLVYNEQIKEYTQLKNQIINKYNLDMTGKNNINRYIIKCKSEIDSLQSNYLKLTRENSILKSEITKYL